MRTFFTFIAAAAALCTLLVPGTAAAQPTPRITASLTGGGVWGGGFDPSMPVTVKVLAADDTLLETVAAETDVDGNFQLEPGELATDLVPGMQVVATSGAWTRELTLAQLTFDRLDPGADVASGTAPVGTTVVVETWPGDTSVRLTTTALAGDVWMADFGAAHLQVGGSAAAQVFEPDGDSTWASRRAPSLKAVYHYEFQRYDVATGGADWTPGATLELQILASPGGPVLWSGTAVANADQDWLEVGSFDNCCSSEWLGFDLAPGMQFRAADSVTGVVKELTLVPFTIDRVDPVGDAVSGTAPPGAEVWLNLDEHRAETVADEHGAWRIEFDPAELQIGWLSRAEAGTDDDDDDWTGASAEPATIDVTLGRNFVSGTYFSLGGDLAVDVLAADGTPLWSTTVSTGGTRALQLTAGVELVPGMTVRVTDETTGLVKAVKLVPLTVDVADPVHDRAAGTGVPGLAGRVFIWQPGVGGGEVGEIVPAADGTWTFQFPPGMDITPSTVVSALVGDAEADQTWALYVPPVEAIPALETRVADVVQETTLAKPLLEKLESALASLGGSGANVNVGAGINKLGAFVNQVNGLVKAHRLAPETGAALAAEATRILVGLGG